MTEFSAVTEKTVLDGTELMLGASSGDETVAQKFSRNTMNAQNGFINVRDYGAVGDGTTDDTTAINSAIAAAVSANAELHFPSVADAYLVTSTIAIPAQLSVVMYSSMIKATAGGPIMTIGVQGALNEARYYRYRLMVEYRIPGNDSGDWTTDDNCCIEVQALSRCADFHVETTNGGHTGTRFTPSISTAPCGYNTLTFGYLQSHRMAVEIYLVGTGWFNQNTVNVQAIRVSVGIKAGLPRYGVYAHNDGTNIINAFNGNAFNGVNCELNPPAAEEAIPLYLFDSASNRFHDLRPEAINPDFIAKVDGPYSRDNLITLIGLESNSQGLIDIGPNMAKKSPGIVTHENSNSNAFNVIYDSGHLPDLVTTHSNGHTIEGFGFSKVAPTYAESIAQSLSAVTATYIEVASNYCPILRVDFLAGQKHIKVKMVSPTGQLGNFAMMMFDSAGARLDDSGTIQLVSLGSYSVNFGGCYKVGNDQAGSIIEQDLFFRQLNSAGDTPVAYAYIVFGGSATLPQLSNIQISGLADSMITVSPPVTPTVFQDGGRVSDQAPTEGTFIVGDTVRNIAPTAGGVAGWVCTTAGTPGTWKTSGVIGS